MPTIELLIEGKEEGRDGDRLVSRVFTFADGQSRLMTYTTRQAAHLDALLEDGWTLPLFLGIPYDSARGFVGRGEATDFEEELRLCFRQAIRKAWLFHSSRAHMLTSDPTASS